MLFTIILAKQHWFENINIRLFQFINANAGRNPFWDWLAIFFSDSGPYLLIAFFAVAWFQTDYKRRNSLLLATEASIIGLVLNLIIGLVYFHPRPSMLKLGTILISHSPETSFPSDYATLLFSAAFYLLVFERWTFLGLVLLFVSFMTALGRVYSGIHLPFDMLGSTAVSALACFVTCKLKFLFVPLNGWAVNIYQKTIGNFRRARILE